MKPVVLITNRVPSSHIAPLLGWCEIIQGPADRSLMRRSDVLQLAPKLDAIINQAELQVDRELLDKATRLRAVANVSIGVDNLDLPLLNERRVWATNVPDAFVDSTAECTMALLLCVSRRIAEADRYVRSGEWASDGFQPGRWDGMLLKGKTLGVVGFGKIGQAVAERAAAFGLNIIFHRRSPSHDPRYRTLDALMSQSDIVSLHLPLRPATRGLIDQSMLARMPQGGILLNLARGGVLCEDALANALESGKLSGAGLDVFEDEPRPHHALLGMRRVVMTPHIGGGSEESRKAARLSCAENIALILRGHPPVTPVNSVG